MKKTIYKLIVFFGIALSYAVQSSASSSSPLYYGNRSSEYLMTFDYFIETDSTSTTDLNFVNLIIEKQVSYLFGAMSSNYSAGVPKANHKIQILRTQNISNQKARVHYRYNGLVLIENQNSPTYEIALPRDPVSIYEKSTLTLNNRRTYPCTMDSEHYQEEYFWYFWNPNLQGCPLKAQKDFDTISAKISIKPNSIQTFPEYPRLVDSDGLMRIDVLMGMNDEGLSKDPFKSKDLAAGNYRELHQYLLSSGYQARTWTQQEIRKIAPNASNSDVFVETLTKTFAGGQIKKIEIRFFFGPTSDWGGFIFHRFLKDSLENSSVMIYAGHSGLGDYLNLAKIETLNHFKIEFDPSRYQIYFFNGCSSYPYYNDMYFERKGGSKNLDIITNGLATYFSAIVPSTFEVLSALDQYMSGKSTVSYQSLIDSADSNNLIGVNGDEDNDIF